MRRRKRAKKKGGLQTDMVLQITSMADIFTIILVFLLKSFSTGVSTISPSKNIMLPEAPQAEAMIDTVKLEISDTTIVMDDKPIAPLNGFVFPFEDMDRSGASKALNEAFRRYAQRSSYKKNSGLLLLADQNVPFSTIKRVLTSANMAGYVDYKLVVAEGQ